MVTVKNQVARGVVSLIGGFKGSMTPEDTNAWHEYLNKRPEWTDFRRQEALVVAMELAMQSGVGAPTIDAMVEAKLKMSDLEERLYLIGKEWYERHVRSRMAGEFVIESLDDLFSVVSQDQAATSRAAAQAARLRVSQARARAASEMASDEELVGDVSDNLLSDLPGQPTPGEVADGVPPSVAHPDAFRKA